MMQELNPMSRLFVSSFYKIRGAMVNQQFPSNIQSKTKTRIVPKQPPPNLLAP